MAGVKGRSGGARPNSGGARPGSGRKKKTPAVSSFRNPLEFLRAVWKGEIDPTAAQVRAACAALPFVHRRPEEPGKKARKAAAAVVAANRFKPIDPPKLRLVRGLEVKGDG